MIHLVEELKRTEQSFPFSEAEEKCALNERGYEEKEYLFRHGFGIPDGKRR